MQGAPRRRGHLQRHGVCRQRRQRRAPQLVGPQEPGLCHRPSGTTLGTPHRARHPPPWTARLLVGCVGLLLADADATPKLQSDAVRTVTGLDWPRLLTQCVPVCSAAAAGSARGRATAAGARAAAVVPAWGAPPNGKAGSGPDADPPSTSSRIPRRGRLVITVAAELESSAEMLLTVSCWCLASVFKYPCCLPHHRVPVVQAVALGHFRIGHSARRADLGKGPSISQGSPLSTQVSPAANV